MVAIKLPDGSVMNFDGAVSGKEVAEKISRFSKKRFSGEG